MTMSETHELGVYLAGTDEFRTDAVVICGSKKSLCTRFGFEGVFPMDTVTVLLDELVGGAAEAEVEGH